MNFLDYVQHKQEYIYPLFFNTDKKLDNLVFKLHLLKYNLKFSDNMITKKGSIKQENINYLYQLGFNYMFYYKTLSLTK